MEEITKTIDLEKAIRSSKSKFVRSLPRFVIRMIEKLVRQDEMNETIFRNRDKNGVPFVNAVLKDWNVNVEVKGSENIPAAGRFVFVANHPVGGMDALSFLSAIHRFFPDVISPSNELFNYIPNLHPVILGVNVFGTNTRDTVEKFNQLFESDNQIMIFPAGIVSRRKKGVISDPAWQKTFITKAIQFNRDVIPVFIEGRNSNLFYSVDRFRKFIGIKMSLEIILLPREMHKQRNSTVTLNFKKPIPCKTFSADKTHADWALYVREAVYNKDII
ncbi:MAG: 1-acyl-sn-glycerol-3-phosphate acyltransferase [Bacteroidales bacterium]|nr:1-acyl-sn-glycerol-3-phosphate acyltransferase [Bacteroidales bacterium]